MKLKPGRPVDSSQRTYARRIGVHRQARGWSQAELARRAKVGRAALSSWESQRNRIPLPWLARLARVLRVDTGDLL